MAKEKPQPQTQLEFIRAAKLAVRTNARTEQKFERFLIHLWETGPATQDVMARACGTSRENINRWVKVLRANDLYLTRPDTGKRAANKDLTTPLSDAEAAAGRTIEERMEEIRNETPEQARLRYAALLEECILPGMDSTALTKVLNTIPTFRPGVKAPEVNYQVQILVGQQGMDQTKAEMLDDARWLKHNSPSEIPGELYELLGATPPADADFEELPQESEDEDALERPESA